MKKSLNKKTFAVSVAIIVLILTLGYVLWNDKSKEVSTRPSDVDNYPFAWLNFENKIMQQNEALPIEFDEGFILDKISARSYDKALVYHYELWNVDSLKNSPIDRSQIRALMISRCSEFRSILGPLVKSIVYEYSAKDGSTLEINIEPSDCRF